ncbi:MAG TPA: inositol monophosphatase family protein, partial [Candidatus Kapabacteria bacterium]|nr:inositol monophosphatase family protein [Candidatus Kapabacteria bacterium]
MALLNISKLITLDRHIETEEELHPEATGDLTLLLQDLTLAIRLISNEVRHAGLNGILGSTNNKNIHGETVRKLDDYANQIIINAMEQGGHTAALISEESENVIFTNNKKKSKYFLAFDPLDGSTNIDVYGTI